MCQKVPPIPLCCHYIILEVVDVVVTIDSTPSYIGSRLILLFVVFYIIIIILLGSVAFVNMQDHVCIRVDIL